MANELSHLSPPPGSTRKRTRVGRGEGSGKGTSAGRGRKGQWSRSTVRPGFEGGQMPLARRLPKRGFKNHFAKQYSEVRLDRIAAAFSEGEVVDAEALKARGLVRKVARDGVKVLGNGGISFAVTVRAAAFTASAKASIEAAGGSAEVV
ncbi:MAG: 50S ribosomal protein L15 [Deltaproteobacteria bacterium]|nr:MAG: 50S ribosomal protein L15 [Deltaproteobacteria bacterium]